MILLYSHCNPILVENVKNLLQNQAIEVVCRNQYLSSGFGELSGIDTWPELWLVNERDYIKANAIILSLNTKTNEREWCCPHCEAENPDNFTTCWQCQMDAPLKEGK